VPGVASPGILLPALAWALVVYFVAYAVWRSAHCF
jgi:hypothetical protein